MKELLKKVFSDWTNFTGSIKEEENIKVHQFLTLKIYITEIVILNNTIQDLGEIIGIILIIKIVGTRVAIWQKSIPIVKMEK